MKKTAMQLAIEHYEKLSLQGSNQAYVVAKFLKDNYLEMEKQQIEKAYSLSCTFVCCIETKDGCRCGKQYYEKTYKSK